MNSISIKVDIIDLTGKAQSFYGKKAQVMYSVREPQGFLALIDPTNDEKININLKSIRGIEVVEDSPPAKEKLQTLKHFNQVKMHLFATLKHGAHAGSNPSPNGILCPECLLGELLDTYPHQTLQNDPPEKVVHCAKCGWRGRRLA